LESLELVSAARSRLGFPTSVATETEGPELKPGPYLRLEAVMKLEPS